MKLYKTVADPSRPSDKRRARSSRSWDNGGGGERSQKKLFQPFGPQFGLTIRGGGGGWGGGPPPGSITAKVTVKIEIVQKVKHSKKYICL